MRAALEVLDDKPRSFLYEGEMNSDVALDPEIRQRLFPNSRMQGAANVLVFANVDTASVVRNILKAKANAIEVGPILMGMGNRAHIVTPSISARGLLNTAALAGTSVQSYG
jgi:malate dehydrogenase (oxaloacetate-decarboxylating)(NADP+)